MVYFLCRWKIIINKTQTCKIIFSLLKYKNVNNKKSTKKILIKQDHKYIFEASHFDLNVYSV